MRAGTYQCQALDAGTLTIEGGSMFSTAAPAAWRELFPADSQGRVTFAIRCLLLQGGGETVLVDCGCGTSLPVETAAAYGVDRSGPLARALAMAGVSPDQVTRLLLTHLHFDHAGGITRRREGRLELAYPRAEHILQRTHLEAALTPRPEEADSFIAEDVQLLAGSPNLRLLEGPGEFLPGLAVGAANGHTTGQQYLVVQDQKMPLLYAADVIPTAAHLQFPWFTAFDMDGRLAVREKRELLERAAAGNHLVIFDHDPRFAGCTVHRNGRVFRAGRVVRTF